MHARERDGRHNIFSCKQETNIGGVNRKLCRHVARTHLIRLVGEAADLAWDGIARPPLAGGATNPRGAPSFLPLFGSSNSNNSRQSQLTL